MSFSTIFSYPAVGSISTLYCYEGNFNYINHVTNSISVIVDFDIELIMNYIVLILKTVPLRYFAVFIH